MSDASPIMAEEDHRSAMHNGYALPQRAVITYEIDN